MAGYIVRVLAAILGVLAHETPAAPGDPPNVVPPGYWHAPHLPQVGGESGPPGLFFQQNPWTSSSPLRFEPVLPPPQLPQDPLGPEPPSRRPRPPVPGLTAPPEGPIPGVPVEHSQGYSKYMRWCAACHGPALEGNGDRGPSFLDPHYGSQNHNDSAFYRAALYGVNPPHHWHAPMPPLPGITRGDLSQIIPFIRWAQTQVGLE